MSEFEKWYKNSKYQLSKDNTRLYLYEAWQAATAERDKLVTELQAKNSELSASINVLRENLDYAYYEVNTHFAKNIKDLLATTPAQSLIQHDNEMIERVVTLLKDWTWGDGIIDMRADDLIEDVRKLKGKQNE